MMRDDILETLVSEEQLRARVRELGQQISRDYCGQEVVLVSVLKGSVVFMADLMREIDLHTVARTAELAAFWRDVVPCVLDINQLPQQLLARHVFIDRHFRFHRIEIVRRSQAV